MPGKWSRRMQSRRKWLMWLCAVSLAGRWRGGREREADYGVQARGLGGRAGGFELGRAAVGLGGGADDGQPEARAPGLIAVAAARVVEAREPVEDPLQVGRGNTRSVVGHGQHAPPVLAVHAHRYL